MTLITTDHLIEAMASVTPDKLGGEDMYTIAAGMPEYKDRPDTSVFTATGYILREAGILKYSSKKSWYLQDDGDIVDMNNYRDFFDELDLEPDSLDAAVIHIDKPKHRVLAFRAILAYLAGVN